jgi:23S rRNA pseudouridine1911/1915/1917 synthase
VLLNDVPLEGWMNPVEGDVIRALMPEEASTFPEEDIPVYPVLDDQDLLIINKQAGFIVHPTKGHPAHTIANGVMKYMREHDESFKIRFVNRLDMDTTGLLILAKNSHAQDDLTRQMKNGGIEKHYIAIVNGIVDADEFTIDLPIGRSDPEKVARQVLTDGTGRPSVTHVKVLERFSKGYTMVELRLETGRTHQIRVHMSHIGHPVVGDYLYGGDNPWLIERQALHAYKLRFHHPGTGEITEVTAPLPDDIKKVIETVR